MKHMLSPEIRRRVRGHINEARVHPTLEVRLRTEDVAVRRAHDAATGLDLLDLPPAPPLTEAPPAQDMDNVINAP
jgi:hypothetical protein